MPSARKWFGVKMVLRTVATGRVRGRDAGPAVRDGISRVKR